jgi:MFS family permease
LFFAYLYVDRANIGSMASIIKAEFGLDNTRLGFLFSTFSYAYLAVVWFGGWLGDRFGARITLFACGLVFSVGTIATGFAESWAMLLAARALVGAGEAATIPIASRAIATWIHPVRRGVALGFTHGAARIGTAVTPPLFAWLFSLTSSWREPFVIVGMLGLVLMACWLWYFRDDPRSHPSVLSSESFSWGESHVSGRIPYTRLFVRYLPQLITYFCYGWTLWIFLNWIPSFFSQNYKVDLKTSALLSGGVLVSGVFGNLISGVLSDFILNRTGSLFLSRVILIIISYVLVLICILATMLSSNLTLVTIALALAFFFSEFSVPAHWLLTMDVSPRYAATAGSFLALSFAVSGILSPLFFGYLLDLTNSWQIPFFSSMVLLAIGAVAALWIRPERTFYDVDDAAAPLPTAEANSTY